LYRLWGYLFRAYFKKGISYPVNGFKLNNFGLLLKKGKLEEIGCKIIFGTKCSHPFQIALYMRKNSVLLFVYFLGLREVHIKGTDRPD
jgi:hypothetical protein